MPSPDPRSVFIVYGRNARAHTAMKLFLRALKLDPLDFDQVRNSLGGAPYVGNIVRAGMDRAKAIVVLFTPDEYAALRPSLRGDHDPDHEQERWQSRPNVILEAGMALGIDESRTVLVVLGDVALSSDLHGRHYVRMNNSMAQRERLKNILQGIGCTVDQYATDWNDPATGGDFETCLKPPALPEVSASSPFRAAR